MKLNKKMYCVSSLLGLCTALGKCKEWKEKKFRVCYRASLWDCACSSEEQLPMALLSSGPLNSLNCHLLLSTQGKMATKVGLLWGRSKNPASETPAVLCVHSSVRDLLLCISPFPILPFAGFFFLDLSSLLNFRGQALPADISTTAFKSHWLP